MYPILLLLLLLPTSPALPAIPDPEPVSSQQFLPTQPPPATIPAFPEQSNLAGCPLNLPDQLFHDIKSACAVKNGKPVPDPLHRTRCCPVLATWLYSAYSDTALVRASRAPNTASYDLPLLPDDSETCVDGFQKRLNEKGIELMKVNETCDVVYCYCGIRLHPFSCPEAFSVLKEGKVVGDESVKRLERDCTSDGVNGYAGLGGCSKCLNSLYQVGQKRTGNSSKSEVRSKKMQNKDCKLMGLTWLLAQNRTAYLRTVSSVVRALMMSNDGSDPRSCSLNSDGMPLAVDSSEINGQSSSTTFKFPLLLCILVSLLLVPRTS